MTEAVAGRCSSQDISPRGAPGVSRRERSCSCRRISTSPETRKKSPGSGAPSAMTTSPGEKVSRGSWASGSGHMTPEEQAARQRQGEEALAQTQPEGDSLRNELGPC